MPSREIWEANRDRAGECDGSVDRRGRCRAWSDDSLWSDAAETQLQSLAIAAAKLYASDFGPPDTDFGDWLGGAFEMDSANLLGLADGAYANIYAPAFRAELARLREQSAATAATVTDAQIRTLRTEAGQAGDHLQVKVCDLALDGDIDARADCAETIAVAKAMY